MEDQKIITQINRLIEKTREKKIIWAFINSNLFRWVQKSGEGTYTTTLQVQPIGITKNYFLTMQVIIPSQIPQIIVQVNSATQPDFRDCLEKLYKEILLISEDKTAETISKLLDSIQ